MKSRRTVALPTYGYALYTLGLLFSMDVLNYTDRFALSAVLEDVKGSLGITEDKALGALHTMFIVGYIVAAPITGYLSDRYSRVRIVAVCVAIFSVATMASAFATNFTELAVARCFIGIGEAGYLVAAPTLVADSFPKRQRGRMMSVLYLGMPLGTALGFMGGRSLAVNFDGAVMPFFGAVEGWRFAFLMVGLPGLVAAALSWFLREPPRGAIEVSGPAPRKRRGESGDAPARAQDVPTAGAPRPTWGEYGALLKNRTYVFTTITFTLVAFSGGSLVFWAQAFLERVRGYDKEYAAMTFGGAAVVGGIVGAIFGGWLGDRLAKRTPAAYLYIATGGYLVGVPALYMGLHASSRWMELGGFGVAVGAVSMSIIALNTTVSNVVAPNRRAAAYAFLIFFQHLFGDAISPPLIGVISDWYNDGVATTESAQGLEFAMNLAPIPMLFAAGTAMIAARYLVRDRPKLDAEFERAMSTGTFAKSEPHAPKS